MRRGNDETRMTAEAWRDAHGTTGANDDTEGVFRMRRSFYLENSGALGAWREALRRFRGGSPPPTGIDGAMPSKNPVCRPRPRSARLRILIRHSRLLPSPAASIPRSRDSLISSFSWPAEEVLTFSNKSRRRRSDRSGPSPPAEVSATPATPNDGSASKARRIASR